MSSPSFSSGTEPSRTHRANISAPPVMWLSTSRTVHAVHGDGLSSWSGSMRSTTCPVSEMTLLFVAASSMSPPAVVEPVVEPTFAKSFFDGHNLDQLVDPEAAGAPPFPCRPGRGLLQQPVHRGRHTVQPAEHDDLAVEVVG